MSIGERVPARQRSLTSLRPGEMKRLGMIAFAILLLHILAASLLLPASSRGPSKLLEETTASFTD
ncbi:MAG TPA: hypothetical protein VID30_09130 [Bradyrhizobium sp.]|jgi:hypothetical protein